MIAALPMYDWPELRADTDALWDAIRAALAADGVDAPAVLTRGRDPWTVWRDPDLVLAQTCGMPFRTRLAQEVTLVATPDYGLPDARPGHYYSQLVVAADRAGPLAEFLGGTLALNGFDSQSGFAAPLNAAGRGFAGYLVTGAHRQSAAAVADGRADIAAIDAVTWRLIVAHSPETARRLRVIGRTGPTPGLPLITARGRDPAPLARAVDAAIAALPAESRARLGIRGTVAIPADAYLAVPTPSAPDQIGG